VIFDVPIKDYESTIKDKIPKNKKVTEIEIWEWKFWGNSKRKVTR
jgi:hypothetical protein